MPTEEWFKENPKVAAYISPDLNQRLLEWMKQRNIRKVSQGLTVILEEHLGIVQSNSVVQSFDDGRLTTVEGKMAAIEGK